MKDLIKLTNLLILTIIVVFTSCEEMYNLDTNNKINYNNSPRIKVENGILKFASNKDFVKTCEFIMNSDENALNQWEQQLGFISLRRIQNNALNELDSITNKEDIELWLKDHKDLFKKIVNENNEEEIVPLYDYAFYNSIINEKQMYAIGNNLYLLRKNKIFMIPISDREEVENLNLEQLEQKYKGFEVIKKVQNNKDHPIRHIAIAIRDERGCRKDRKVKIENYIVHGYYNDNGIFHYFIYVYTQTRGYRKLLCIWRPYKTQLTYKNVYGEVTYNNGIKKRFRILDMTSYINTYEIYSYTLIESGYTTNSEVLRQILSNVYFTRDHGEATSRGVGNLWAIIRYNE